MPKRTSRYRPWLINQLKDPRAAASYLRAALQDTPPMFLKAVRMVLEAHQMSKVAQDAGVSRESLYRMFSETGNPTYSSLDSVLRTLGLRLSVEPLQPLAGRADTDTVERKPATN
jgi:probable addiction module antidote protein